MLYTIGHSNRKIEEFIDILKEKNIKIIIDTRWNLNNISISDYEKENLMKILSKNKIFYRHFDKEFIPKNLNIDDLMKINCIDNLIEKPSFKNGMKKLEIGVEKGYNIALLCKEKHPEKCQRFFFISYGFYKNNIDITHIIDKNQSILTSELIKIVEENEVNKSNYKYLYKQRPIQLIFRDLLIERLTDIKNSNM